MLPLPSSAQPFGVYENPGLRPTIQKPNFSGFRDLWRKIYLSNHQHQAFFMGELMGYQFGISLGKILGKNPGIIIFQACSDTDPISWGFHTENKMQVIDGNWAFYHPASDANEDSTIQNSAIGIIKPCYKNGVLSNKKWNHQIWGVDQQYTGM